MLKRTEETFTTIYTCETCGNESDSHDNIKRCELRHKQTECEHDTFLFAYGEGYYDDQNGSIEKICSKCSAVLEERAASLDDLNSEQLKQIFEILEAE